MQYLCATPYLHKLYVCSEAGTDFDCANEKCRTTSMFMNVNVYSVHFTLWTAYAHVTAHVSLMRHNIGTHRKAQCKVL